MSPAEVHHRKVPARFGKASDITDLAQLALRLMKVVGGFVELPLRERYLAETLVRLGGNNLVLGV